ncbi:MAG: hypothetical protein ACI9F9_001117 [Candidatus Paceibacteria bacterium]|jgi:hypothetical protein
MAWGLYVRAPWLATGVLFACERFAPEAAASPKFRPLKFCDLWWLFGTNWGSEACRAISGQGKNRECAPGWPPNCSLAAARNSSPDALDALNPQQDRIACPLRNRPR